MAPKLKLTDVLLAATDSDLEDIDSQISKIQSEIDEFFAERRQKLDALKACRKLVDVKLHGKQRVKRGEGKATKRAAGEPSELQTRIYDLIAKEGSLPIPAIAARLDVRGAGVGIAVSKSKWFEKVNGEVCIAKTG